MLISPSSLHGFRVSNSTNLFNPMFVDESLSRYADAVEQAHSLPPFHGSRLRQSKSTWPVDHRDSSGEVLG